MKYEVKQGILKVENLQEFLSKYGDKAVFLNADYIVDENHVYFAVKKALKAWEKGRKVAKSLPLEVMLYAAATRQIRDAIKLGVKEGVNKVVGVFFNNVKVDDFEEKKVLEDVSKNKEKLRRIVDFFDISEEELKVVGAEKIPLLIRERIVLFDIEK